MLALSLALAGCGDPLGPIARLDCATGCTLPHAITTCVDDCAIDFCEIGFGDCNHEPADGCEVALSANPNHCGACGNACDGCAKGSCRAVETLATLPEAAKDSGSAGLVVSGANVYFIAGYPFPSRVAPTELYVVEKQGGEPRLVPTGAHRLASLGVGETSLFAIALEPNDDPGASRAAAHSVLELATDTGQVTELARRDGEPQGGPIAVGGHVYWGYLVRDLEKAAYLPGGALMRVPRAGGAAEAIKLWDVPGGPTSLASYESNVYFGNITINEGKFAAELAGFATESSSLSTLHAGLQPHCLVADAVALYGVIMKFSNGRFATDVWRVPLDGSEAQLLWSTTDGAFQCAQSARHVYVSTGLGTIFEIDKADGSSALLAGAQGLSFALASDDAFLYWVTVEELRRVPID